MTDRSDEDEPDRDPLAAAERTGRRAAREGFDWPDASGPLAKIREELGELEAEIDASEQSEEIEDELGDLLFAVVNLARHLDIDPGTALRGATDKFDRRFRRVRRLARAADRPLRDYSVEELDTLWRRAKDPPPDS